MKSVKIDGINMKKVLVNGNVWFNAARLPSAFQEVEWIAGNGSQGLAVDVNKFIYEVVIKARVMWDGTDVGGYSIFSGSTGSGGSTNLISPINIKSLKWGNTQRSGWITSSVSAVANRVTDISGRSSADYAGFVSVDGVNVLSDLRNYDDNKTDKIPIMAYIDSNGVLVDNYCWHGRCYSCSIEDLNGNELAKLVPCYRKSDSAIGMYDIIGNTFYTNIGKGTFTKGPNV